MPYVTDSQKKRIDLGHTAVDAGELTYEIQQLLKQFIEKNGLRYSTLASCLGALEGAKIDLTENVIKGYEIRKRTANGDVWPKWITTCLPSPKEVEEQCNDST